MNLQWDVRALQTGVAGDAIAEELTLTDVTDATTTSDTDGLTRRLRRTERASNRTVQYKINRLRHYTLQCTSNIQTYRLPRSRTNVDIACAECERADVFQSLISSYTRNRHVLRAAGVAHKSRPEALT
ncbi:hypothetical protein EVAR_9130_1 [Eumeta japonica]|uniref:Uncharacterized protein n=1 Tax=Eumeta variegata TaxID=151549 RepID=A0A4C1TXC7_EUMVA|nr:hypothetical protein EVAR_9130_1 [Eumeta japonica]